MTAYIAYDNKIPLGTVTAVDTPGFEKENAFDWFTYTWWNGGDDFQVNFPGPETVNYLAISAHDLGTKNAEISFFEGANSLFTPFTPVDDKPILIMFPDSLGPLFSLRFANYSTFPFIGVLSFGEILELPEGIKPSYTPPPWGHDDKILNTVSQTGQFLGRSVERYGLKHQIKQSQVDPEWMRENWLPLANAIRTQPFFFSWDFENHPEDCVYSWLDNKLPNPIYTNPIYTDFTINCRALYDSE